MGGKGSAGEEESQVSNRTVLQRKRIKEKVILRQENIINKKGHCCQGRTRLTFEFCFCLIRYFFFL